jgi:hypothetical protein
MVLGDNLDAPSLDRIDPEKGYVLGNILSTHTDVVTMAEAAGVHARLLPASSPAAACQTPHMKAHRRRSRKDNRRRAPARPAGGSETAQQGF